MKARIPSLTALRAFEAVARKLSFRGAADELFVTHAAISHQIKSLELEIGVALFIRDSHSVHLTAEGRFYYPIVRDCLAKLAEGTEQLKTLSTDEVLAVQSYSSFANMWLMPRLIEFQRGHPELRLRVKTSFEDADLDTQRFDVGVFKAPPFDDRLDYRPLFTTDLFPVCAPALLNGSRPLRKPADLTDHTLLIIPQNDYEPNDWHLWLAAAGVPVDKMTFGPVYDNYPMALEAVLKGHGLAIARRPFAQADLAEGRLARPFDISVKEPGAWYFVCRKGAGSEPRIKLFEAWLFDEVARDPTVVTGSEGSETPNAEQSR